MAWRVQMLLVDDLDGSDAETTVRFGLDGSQYEIDLNGAHAEDLRGSLAPYVGYARRVSGGADEPDSTQVRERGRARISLGTRPRSLTSMPSLR